MMLEQILQYKREFISQAKNIKLPSVLRDEAQGIRGRCRGFRKAIEESSSRFAVIAEIKRRSPSRGVLRADMDVAAVARGYERAGAAAISVLTDEKFFEGSFADLSLARRSVTVPVLRKDFIIDEYQIDESRVVGADAVLLIARLLERDVLDHFKQRVESLGMDALIEIHSSDDLAKIEGMESAMIGINSRDLSSFEVNVEMAKILAGRIRDHHLVIAESGISTAAQMSELKKAGARGFLIGERLIAQADPAKALRALLKEGAEPS